MQNFNRQINSSREANINREPPLIGGQYKFIQVIGTGTSGRALLVHDTLSNHSCNTPQQLVLKEIKLSGLTCQREKVQARKEIVILSKLNHPNIIRYLNSFEDGQYLYIATEYAENGDLYSFLKERKESSLALNGYQGKFHEMKHLPYLEESVVIGFFRQICEALQYLHERKILHRDLKSKNIFLSNQNSTIKLGDFGISRFLNSTTELAQTAIGTPYYLSPEICESKPYHFKSDIWALGCVLYELLTLQHPFEAKNMKGLVLKILRVEYSPIPT